MSMNTYVVTVFHSHGEGSDGEGGRINVYPRHADDPG